MTRDGQAAQTARPPKAASLRLRSVLAAAFRAGRADLGRVLAVAVAVSTVTAVAEIIVDHYTDPTNAVLSASAGISAEGVSMLGTVFLAGFLCRLVGAAGHGGEHQTLRQVAARLPWWRLILADIAIALLTVAGLIALVIPGLIILNLLILAGPVIEIEHRRVWPALRRSARLVRQHFWKTALVASLPLLIIGELESAIPSPEGVPEIIEILAIRGLGEAAVEAAIGLILVELCYTLIAQDRSRPPSPARGSR
ncbi:MAG TPA: hypothetical protein VGG25_29040 [Streptosporangiaceae bacterium]|jgi:hypothetical protein